MSKVIVIALIILLWSCKSRQVEKSESISKTDQQSHIQDDNSLIDKSVETSKGTHERKDNSVVYAFKASISPIDNTKPLRIRDNKGNTLEIENGKLDTERTNTQTNIKESSQKYESLKNDLVISNSKKESQHFKVEKLDSKKETKSEPVYFSYWWILIIIPLYLIYKYRIKIKSFVTALF